MKKLFFCCLAITLPFVSLIAQSDQLYNETDVFLNKYVRNGLVDYAEVATNIATLNSLVQAYEQVSAQPMEQANEIALSINAYNLLVIKKLADAYPVESPQAIPGFFDERFFELFGKKMSLNELEKKVLFKKFPDARYHFALVCGALGCPPLQKFAFRPETLDNQLEQTTGNALQNTSFIRLESGKILVSEIFRWYAEDFPKGRIPLIEYLNGYRTDKISETLPLGYYTYDWSINDIQHTEGVAEARKNRNLQAITPSILYGPEQFEIKNFANLYTQTAFFNTDGNRTDINGRETFFTNTIQFTYGISSKVNIGFDMYIRATRFDTESSSPFKTFSFENEPNVSRAAVTHLGYKVKVAPFDKLQNLSFQGVMLFPLESNLFGNDPPDRFLDFNGIQTFFQVFYDKPLSPSFSVFTQADIFVAFGGDQGIARMPLKAFLSYFPTSKITLYAFGEYGPELSSFPNYYSQAGLGAKYQLLPGLELEFSSSVFPIGLNNGAGTTFNFGLRFVK